MGKFGFRNTGTPYVYEELDSGGSVAIGLDSADSGVFKITVLTTPGSTPGDGNEQMEIDPSTNGDITFIPNGSGALVAEKGNIIASLGNISSTVGSVSAATTVTAGTGITATTGNIVASSGAISASSTVTGGTGLVATTGNITASSGAISASGTVTGGTGIVATTGSITASSGNLIASTGNIAATLGSVTAGAGLFSSTGVTVNSFGRGMIRSSSVGVFSSINGTDGQVLVAATGADPAWASISAGTNISITPGANTVTIASTATPGISWTEVTGTSVSMAVNSGYILNNAGLVTATLPASAVVGSVISIVGKGTGGWSIAQNSGQTIHFGTGNTTTGVGGSISSTNRYDCIEIVCTTANTDFVAKSSFGNPNGV